MDTPALVDQQRLIYISCVQILDVVWRTCQKLWMIEMDREKESGNFLLSARLDDDISETCSEQMKLTKCYQSIYVVNFSYSTATFSYT